MVVVKLLLQLLKLLLRWRVLGSRLLLWRLLPVSAAEESWQHLEELNLILLESHFLDFPAKVEEKKSRENSEMGLALYRFVTYYGYQ